MRFFLLSFTVQSVLFGLAVAQNCPMDIWLYDSWDACVNNFKEPSAQGRLYADGKCHSTEVVSSFSSDAETKLPGIYEFRCVAEGIQTVEFLHSGCNSQNCSSTASAVCDQNQDNPAALYSTVDSPYYNITTPASRNDLSYFCAQIYSASTTITFAIFGNCSDPACFESSATHQPSTLHPSTIKPTTPAPTTPKPTTPAPTTPKPTTPAPTTPKPATPVPTTPKPATPAPTTPKPATPAPTTPKPATPVPTTPKPATPAPTTPKPATPVPTTPRPTTPAPTTPKPITPSPTTPEPTTQAPTKPGNSTTDPTTLQPTHNDPPTHKPSTAPPTTEPPSNVTPRPTDPATKSPEESSENYAGVIASTFVAAFMVVLACLAVGLVFGHRKVKHSLHNLGTTEKELGEDHSDSEPAIVESRAAKLGGEPSGGEKSVGSTAGSSSPRIISIPDEMDEVSTLELPNDVLMPNDEQSSKSPFGTGFLDLEATTYQPTLDTSSVSPSLLSIREKAYLDDDASFEKFFENQTLADRLFDVTVPPGPLGICLQTPQDAPEVFSIRIDSVLLGKVRIGDQLVAVDGVVVSDLGHDEVLRVINVRSDAKRRLTFKRLSSDNDQTNDA